MKFNNSVGKGLRAHGPLSNAGDYLNTVYHDILKEETPKGFMVPIFNENNDLLKNLMHL